MRMAILIVLVLALSGCSTQEASPEVAYSAVLKAIESTQAEIEETVDLRSRARDMISDEGHKLMDAGTLEKASKMDKDMIRVYTETSKWLKDFDEKKNKLLRRKAQLENQMGL